MKRLLFCILVLAFVSEAFSQRLVVELCEIRNREGLMRLALFDSESGFQKEQPCLERKVEKSLVVNGRLTIQVDSVAPGWYGIALLDDENRNGRLDFRLLLPKEGVGFSNLERLSLRKPRFRDFSFYLDKNKTVRIPIRMMYF